MASREQVAARWTTIIMDQPASGLSVSSYCRKVGVNSKAFYYWRVRLNENTSNRAIDNEHVPAVQSTEKLTVFTEVKLPDTLSSIPDTRNNDQGELAIKIRNITISANSAYPVLQLLQLLQGLQIKC